MRQEGKAREIQSRETRTTKALKQAICLSFFFRSMTAFFLNSAFSSFTYSPYFLLWVLDTILCPGTHEHEMEWPLNSDPWLGIPKCVFPDTLGFLTVPLSSVSNLKGMAFPPSFTLGAASIFSSFIVLYSSQSLFKLSQSFLLSQLFL